MFYRLLDGWGNSDIYWILASNINFVLAYQDLENDSIELNDFKQILNL